MRRQVELVLALFTAAILPTILAGCARGDPTPSRTELRPTGTLGPGFIDTANPPPPEGTITPSPGSWDAVHPPRGYRVVLLSAGEDHATTTLVRAVIQWASAERVNIQTVKVTAPDKLVDGIVDAMERGPDLIISVGNDLIDPLALVTASHLDKQFLVVGAQLPEPTANVTAAVWRGASSKGGEVPDTPSTYDANAFTPERADAAIRAGVASVLNNFTGIVIWLS